MSGEASATAQVDDERVQVVRHDMAPGNRIPRHRHERDYVVVPLTDGEFQAVGADGAVVQQVRAGESYRRSAGAEHVNGERPYAFIEIEIVPEGAADG